MRCKLEMCGVWVYVCVWSRESSSVVSCHSLESKLLPDPNRNDLLFASPLRSARRSVLSLAGESDVRNTVSTANSIPL